jgi:2,4-dienoyl-CoA reductase-like NADH-dependent reductase (Old Yellow Enzyme family)
MHKSFTLFDSIDVNGIRIKNRIAMAPMGTAFCHSVTGEVTDQLMCYYAARAKGGAGLIILEHTACTYKYWKGAKFLGFHTSNNLAGMRQLCDCLHVFGAKVVVQLSLGLGRSTTSSATRCPLVAPSPYAFEVPKGSTPRALRRFEGVTGEIPRELSREEIEVLENDYVRAVKRIERAGFDGIEVHAAHGYLLAQFLSPISNRRLDEYGGSFGNRLRIIKNVISKSKGSVNTKFIIGVRFSGDEHVQGGYTLEEGLEIARAIEEMGADYLHLSSGRIEAMKYMFPDQPNVILPEAEAVSKVVKIPVICPNIHDSVVAKKVIENGEVDMISLGRTLIADPYWPNKVQNRKEKEINRCTFCGTCLKSVFDGFSLRCDVNTEVGWERFNSEYYPLKHFFGKKTR